MSVGPSPDFPRRGGMWWRFLLAGLAIVVLSAGVTATVGLNTFQGFVDDFKQGGTIGGVANVLERADVGDPQTLLLIGSDHRLGDDRRNARSDTMMLVRLDPDAAATTVLSIPRDLKVDYTYRGVLSSDRKINETYTVGGEALTAKVIRRLLGVEINHIVNVNFRAFRRAVDAIDCVYVDVDRRYYHSNVGLPASLQYAEIDVSAGYQRLCGTKALDYVRYRHGDNDFVRAARQQDFLRQARSQYGVDRFLDDPREITKEVGKEIRTDAALQSKEELIKLVNLVAFSARDPIREVHFPVTYDNSTAGSFVTATDEQLRAVRREFLSPPPADPGADGGDGKAAGERGGKRRKPRGPKLDGLVDAEQTGADHAIQLGGMKFPVYYPKLLHSGSRYMDPERNARGQLEYPRVYRIKTPEGKMKAAYRLVVAYDTIQGDYYGIQGTTWMEPPILRNPSSDTRTINGKKLLLFYDGRRLRTVAWKTSRAVYWVQNTLSERLSNDQMLAIAGSLTRLGGR